jgi:hypothetical protein
MSAPGKAKARRARRRAISNEADAQMVPIRDGTEAE